jgi:sugar phosphate isomerase/epimerase
MNPMDNEGFKHMFRSWELGLFAPSVSSLTPAQTISLAAAYRYHWLEWRVQTAEALANSPWGPALNTLTLETLETDAPLVAAAARDAGLRTSGLQVDLPAGELHWIPTVLDAARELDCSLVRIDVPRFDPAQGYLAQRDAFRQRLMAWAAQAAGRGVRICIENHFDTLAPSASLVADLLRDFEPTHVGVMWDPANTVLEGSERPELALDQIKAYLAEVHLKNGLWTMQQAGRWTFAWCCLDEGMVNWPAILTLLEVAGYRGPLVVEDYRPLEPEVKLAEARDYLRAVSEIL